MRKLLQAARQLGSTLDPREIYEALVRLLHDSIHFDGLVVSSFDPVAQEIRCEFAWVEGERPDVSKFPPIRLAADNAGMQSRVIRTGMPYLFTDVEQRVRTTGTYYEVTPEGESERMAPEPEPDREYRCTRSAMMAPIVLDGQVLGVVQVMSMKQDAHSQEDLELFEGMVIQVGAAARNAALYVKAQTEVEERTRAQAAIEDLNRRLQRAMAETHHRVKNNLQILAALVDMQLAEGGVAISRSAAERLLMQIQSLASLHDVLTHSAKVCSDAEAVSIAAALPRLIGIIQSAAGVRQITLETEEISIPVRQSTAFALLVNEIISNSLKHGAGDIHVRVELDEAGFGADARQQFRSIRLVVEDSGPGFPIHFDGASTASTGLELIDSLSRWDLNGRVAYMNRPEGGARVVVTFPCLAEEL